MHVPPRPPIVIASRGVGAARCSAPARQRTPPQVREQAAQGPVSTKVGDCFGRAASSSAGCRHSLAMTLGEHPSRPPIVIASRAVGAARCSAPRAATHSPTSMPCIPQRSNTYPNVFVTFASLRGYSCQLHCAAMPVIIKRYDLDNF